jgi:hypothetical protein
LKNIHISERTIAICHEKLNFILNKQKKLLENIYIFEWTIKTRNQISKYST